jgi:hypothetical protein
MKLFMMFGLALLVVMTMGASSCSETVDSASGVHKVQAPDGRWYTEVTPPAETAPGMIIKTAGDATGPIGHYVGEGLLTLLALFQASRKKKVDDEVDALNLEIDKKNKAMAATGVGLQNAANTLGVEQAKIMIHALDSAHDAAGVDGHHQDMIQPVLKL